MSYHIISYHIILYYIILCIVIPRRVIWYHMLSSHFLPYYIIYYMQYYFIICTIKSCLYKLIISYSIYLRLLGLCAGIINITPFITRSIPPSLFGLVISALVAVFMKLPVCWDNDDKYFYYSYLLLSFFVSFFSSFLSSFLPSLLPSFLPFFLSFFLYLLFSLYRCPHLFFSFSLSFFHSAFIFKIKSLSDVAGAATFKGGLTALPTYMGTYFPSQAP